jgi:TetR/AcrR family transcriptional regulator, cholesterol catabolism regulator
VSERVMQEKEIRTQIKDSELVRKKRLQIAMGASKLFIKRGYFQTGIREISKATGLTIGNLYDYIKKKEDILYLVFDAFYTIWVNKLEEEGVLKIDDPVWQLRVSIQKMLELVNDHRDMVLLMNTESKILPKDFLKIFFQKESRFIEYFENILRKGIERGVFTVKDPFFLSNIIVYLLSLEPLRGWNLRKSYGTAELNELIVEFILDKICVQPVSRRMK